MSKTFYILIKGERISVPEDVYYAYKRPEWREAKRREVRADRERSLEGFGEEGFNISSGDRLVEEIVVDKFLLELLMSELNKLAIDDRSLIDALFFEEKSEREIARALGISQPAVHKWRDSILVIIRNKLK